MECYQWARSNMQALAGYIRRRRHQADALGEYRDRELGAAKAGNVLRLGLRAYNKMHSRLGLA